jgi:hypothetical protein
MKPEEANNIRNKLGDLPVFLLIRDPIERDWSDAQMALQYHKSAVQQDDAAYIRYISSDRCQRFSNYIRIIDVWANIFPNFRVFYLDDISRRPRELIRDVCEFLNLAADVPDFTVDEIAPNPASAEIGKFVRSPEVYAAQKVISKPLMEELKDRLGGYATAWYERHYSTTTTGRHPLDTQ